MAVVVVDLVAGSENLCPIGGPSSVGGNNPITQVAITSTSMPNGTTGSVYSFQPTATGSPPPSWTATNVEGIIGLSVDNNTGLTTFTVPAAGTYTIAYTAYNGTTDTKSLTFTAVAAAVDAVITSTTLADTYVGQVPVSGYFIPVTVTGTGPFTFTLTAGSLPSGVTLASTPVADPSQGIFFGTPDTPGAGTSISLKVVGASGVLSSAKVFASGITVYQFPSISTSTFPDLSSNVAVGSGHNVTMTGYPAPTNLSITSGGPTGFSLSGTGTASGNVSYANAGSYTVNLSCSNTCGSFGVQTATAAISLRVYVGLPTGVVNGFDWQTGKTKDAGGLTTTWAAFCGSDGTLSFTAAGYDTVYAVSGSTGLTDGGATNGLQSTATGATQRLANNSVTQTNPYRLGVRVWVPSNITDNNQHYLVTDQSFAPALQYQDNGTTVRRLRFVTTSGQTNQSADAVVRGALNTFQIYCTDATHGGTRLNGTDNSTTSTAYDGFSKISLFSTAAGGAKDLGITRWAYGTVSSSDAAWFDAWLADTYVAGTAVNPGPQSASITYPTASTTIQPGGHYIVVSRGTVPRTGTTGCDIYENGTLVYSYVGDGGVSGVWNSYIHHAAPGSGKSYQAIVRNSVTGDVTTASVGSITVAAQTNGTFRGSIFMEHLHQSGGVTGRLRIALPDNPYNNVLADSHIAGVFQNVEWGDYDLSTLSGGVKTPSYTMRNILTNCDYCWARNKYLIINLVDVSYWGGVNDTSAVPTYIKNGPTATYGVGYNGVTVTSSNEASNRNGKAGVSGRTAGGSAPHSWNPNLMIDWKAWIDNLATNLLPNGVRYPGFFGIALNESTWAVQSSNSINSALINTYGGNQGYGYGNQLIYWNKLQYIASKFPGIPVYASYNGPDGGGGNSTTLMRQAMDRSRAAGHWATGMHDLIMPSSGGIYHNYGQYTQNPAQLYTAYWPPTERTSITFCEDPKVISNTTGDQTTNYWNDFINGGVTLYGCDTFVYGLTGGMASPGVPNYPSTNWTTNASWTTYFSILRTNTTVADYLTNQYA